MEILSTFRVLRSVGWFRTGVSGLRIRPILKWHDVQDV
jgi:hypothetical protein